MVKHICLRCGYIANQKGHLKDHYNRKKKCEPIIENISIDDCLSRLNNKKYHLCEYCGKNFSRSDSLKRHEKKCYERRLKILEDRNKELEKKLENNSLNMINSNNVNINCGNTYNININDFNNTDYMIALDDLKKSIKKSLLKNNGKNMNIECENLVELVHCNDKYPENHNILLTDRNRGEVKVKNGNNFINIPIDDAIDETSQNIINLLKDNKIFMRYIKFHENKDEDTTKEDKKAIERKLYNNREKIKESVKKKGIKI